MKQKYIKYIITLILGLLIFIPNKVCATSNYIIEKYDIKMVVNENNTFDITETITTYFNVAKHGIFRKIPLKNNITRIDGTTSNNRARITNISVSSEYTTYKEKGYEVIKIGNANSTLTGRHTYTIKYTYDIGKDPIKDADELYFNLIGDEWDTKIQNVTFTITMPKKFDKSLLGFSSGIKGSTDSSKIVYNVNGNTITGYVASTLSAGQALTVRLTLPEGYFVGASNKIDQYSILVIILCAVFVLIADRLWVKYGKDDKVIETIEFYPPEGYNSAEIGFLYKGEAQDKDIISLLIYLADKGYLRIEEDNENGQSYNKVKISEENRKKVDEKIQLLERQIEQEKANGNDAKVKILVNALENYKNIDEPLDLEELGIKIKHKINFTSHSKNIKIIKVKEYDGDNEYEKIFFDGLFLHNSKDYTTINDLYNNFYITLGRIKTKLNAKENKNKIFETKASKKVKWIFLMMIFIFVLITVKPLVEYGRAEFAIFALLFPGIAFTMIFKMIFSKTLISIKIFILIWGLGFGGVPWYLVVLPAVIENEMYLITYIIGIVCIIVLMLFAKIMPKRTSFGSELLGKIRGFKRFLEIAEKLQLENLVEENPEYFYNILPYTYALGISDTWINQFEKIALKAPDWYDSSNGFNPHDFGDFMTRTMSFTSVAMVASPVSSGSSSYSGGDSFGGGYSGGGSGGGGGGSW